MMFYFCAFSYFCSQPPSVTACLDMDPGLTSCRKRLFTETLAARVPTGGDKGDCPGVAAAGRPPLLRGEIVDSFLSGRLRFFRTMKELNSLERTRPLSLDFFAPHGICWHLKLSLIWIVGAVPQSIRPCHVRHESLGYIEVCAHFPFLFLGFALEPGSRSLVPSFQAKFIRTRYLMLSRCPPPPPAGPSYLRAGC